MQKNTVQSSIIYSVGYDTKNETLEVVLRRGDTRVYQQVPLSVYTALIESASVGKFFLSNIRGRFDYLVAQTS